MSSIVEVAMLLWLGKQGAHEVRRKAEVRLNCTILHHLCLVTYIIFSADVAIVCCFARVVKGYAC